MFKPELLAPAGDPTRMKYAFAYGADAVFAGQPTFSLRSRENGFKNLDDLAEGIAYAHARGKKFYLTSNIIPRNVKVEAFQKALLAAIDLGPDALIVADPGFVGWIRKVRPEAEIHLSVQANCTNYLTAQFWHDLGVKRVILSRELRLPEILEMKKLLPSLELEVFVHGAVCMSMSGRCMLSNWVVHRDANLGACDNSCRMPYRLYANEGPQVEDYREHEGNFTLQRTDRPELEPIALDEDTWGTYFMSSRDLCAIEVVPELIKGGLESFKIEGRTKSVYYLSQVVRAYRMAIDSCFEQIDAGKEPAISDESRRAVTYLDGRGFMQGFLKGPLPQNYESTHVPADAGCVAAQILDYDVASHSVRVNVKNPFTLDDKLELMTPAGMATCAVESMNDFRGAAADRLNPGTEGRIFLPKDVKIDDNNAEFSFFVKDFPQKSV
ncbi:MULTISPECIES: U32 family peptidase C-terminal domain-containing protein [unclassified Fibrobacter]|uniref:U32 family peptidase C-terminal domain-containing protein n=1 Tax=unclassified Fibrobacter TaxID=2634177 RepID=UPI000D6A9A40|nr:MULTISPECIES: U32 family peptidase C-terminal domain-containing protein [unclassified Fibrobacter]PWJ68536.1 putative protease [Fibrobacter sp. UWR4]PZW72072.1 putative protease [Fibrobacter sp. UWR1]